MATEVRKSVRSVSVRSLLSSGGAKAGSRSAEAAQASTLSKFVTEAER